MSFSLVVLASGAGTNLQAILDQLHGREAGDGEPTIEVVGVGSNRPDAKALERAQAVGVETAVFPASAHPDREARDAAIRAWAEGLGVDLIVLAGYMELLSPQFVARFENRIINVHPALLPSFPGLDAVSQALEHGVSVTGVTVHFVDEGIDSGPIILQQAVPVPADRESETLEHAIHATEHTLLPQAIRLIAAGRVRVEPGSRVVAIRD